MSTPFTATLSSLARHRGVLGVMVASERDGIAVESHVQVGVDVDAVAALAASLHRRARLASSAAGYGASSFLTVEAERGRLCAAGRGDLVLVVVAGAPVNVGLLRVEMLRAVERFA